MISIAPIGDVIKIDITATITIVFANVVNVGSSLSRARSKAIGPNAA